MIPDYFCKTLSSQLCAILLLRLYNWTNLWSVSLTVPLWFTRADCAAQSLTASQLATPNIMAGQITRSNGLGPGLSSLLEHPSDWPDGGFMQW